MSEHDQQAFLFEWVSLSKNEVPELGLLYSIPNQIPHLSKMPKKYRFAIINYMKREGMCKGIPDLHLPVASRGKHGLFIEMKYGKGKLSDEQGQWLDDLDNQGYAVSVCYDWKEAAKDIIEYLDLDRDLFVF